MIQPISFLDLATLPERKGHVETIANFGLRVLTSRLPNRLGGFPGHVLKNVLDGQLDILTIGEPEGKVLVVAATDKQTGFEVSVHTDLFKLIGEGLYSAYDGCSGREWIEAHSARQPEILKQTTRLLGELGLYSGISL